jgi:DNA-binding LacI/PurR family transcriptional regulator
MARHARPRLVDVARLAGVDPSTASRALSRPELVRALTRARVKAAAEQLGYLPDPIARSLITGRRAVIALIVPDLRIPVMAEMCRAAQNEGREFGYDTYILDRTGDPEREAYLVTRARIVADGIILCLPSGTYPRDPEMPPIVSISRGMPGSSSVEVNQATIVEMQLRHLAELGHEKILWMPGRPDLWAARMRRRRLEHLLDELPVEIGRHHEGNDFDAGADAVQHFDPGITAVAAFNDYHAAGIIAKCAELGIRVPDDLSVVGANDVPLARMISPPLTTLHSPYDEVARRAVRILIDRIDDPELAPVTETLEPHLVVRASTAPPRA